jgi:hypothetical protein
MKSQQFKPQSQMNGTQMIGSQILGKISALNIKNLYQMKKLQALSLP